MTAATGVFARLAAWFRPPLDEASVVAHAPTLTLRQLWQRFRGDIRAVRGWLAFSFVLVMVAPLLNAAEIWLFKLVVDHVLVPRDLAALPPLALAYIAFTVAEGAVGFTDKVVSSAMSTRFSHRLRTRCFAHLHQLGPEYLERHRLGDLVTRTSSDVGAIETLLLGGLTRTVSYVVQILVFAGLLLFLNWRLALAAFVGVPLFALVSRRFSRAVKRAARERRRRTGSLSATAESSLRVARLVAAYGAEQQEAAHYAQQSALSVRAEMAAARLRSLYSPIVNLIELFGVLLVMWIGAVELINGRLTMGGMLVFIAYLGELNSPVRGMGSLGNSISSATAGAERIAELLDATPTIHEPASPVVPDHVSGALELDAVTYTYPGSEAPALRGVSLTVPAATSVAVMGESGSGKSTLVALLIRLIDPQHGAVRLDGQDLRRLDLPWLRQTVALSLQEAPLLEGTVRSNLLIARPEAGEEELWAALRDADADQFVAELEGGLDATVGQRGRRLSGGQQVRVAIARALLRDAPVVVLDEPTVGLDVATANRLMDRVMARTRGRTLVLVTHDPDVARRADRLVLIAGGTVVGADLPTELPTDLRTDLPADRPAATGPVPSLGAEWVP